MVNGRDKYETARRRDRGAWLLAGIMLMVAALVCTCTGCRPQVQTVQTVQHDTVTVTTEVTHRDTVFMVAADSAHVAVDTSVAALRRLLEQLRTEKRVIRGERNASVVLSNDNGRLGITAKCDSVEALLENAITTIETQRNELRERETTIAVQAESMKGVMPGWMKGTIWMIVAIVLGAAALLYLFKSVFKLF